MAANGTVSVLVAHCLLLHRSHLATAPALPGPAPGPDRRSQLAAGAPGPGCVGQGWTAGPLTPSPWSRRSDCMIWNVVVLVNTSMSAAASTPVYLATMGAAARSVTASRWALTPAQTFC